jgi:hypothetical protein
MILGPFEKIMFWGLDPLLFYFKGGEKCSNQSSELIQLKKDENKKNK